MERNSFRESYAFCLDENKFKIQITEQLLLHSLLAWGQLVGRDTNWKLRAKEATDHIKANYPGKGAPGSWG